jgi:hypothetical protein
VYFHHGFHPQLAQVGGDGRPAVGNVIFDPRSFFFIFDPRSFLSSTLDYFWPTTTAMG